MIVRLTTVPDHRDISVATVKRLGYAGALNISRIGRARFVDLAELDEVLLRGVDGPLPRSPYPTPA